MRVLRASEPFTGPAGPLQDHCEFGRKAIVAVHNIPLLDADAR